MGKPEILPVCPFAFLSKPKSVTFISGKSYTFNSTTLYMINSRILSIHLKPPENFAVIIKTDTGIYSIQGNGYYKTDTSSIDKEYTRKDYPMLERQTIVSVKSDFEFTSIKLSNGCYIIYHVDTPFLDIVTKENAEEDPDFSDWVENDMDNLNDDKPLLEL